MPENLVAIGFSPLIISHCFPFHPTLSRDGRAMETRTPSSCGRYRGADLFGKKRRFIASSQRRHNFPSLGQARLEDTEHCLGRYVSQFASARLRHLTSDLVGVDLIPSKGFDDRETADLEYLPA